MLLQPYEDAFGNAVFERDVDLARSGKVYAFSTLVPNGGRQTLRLRIPAGSAFKSWSVMGRATGPVDLSGNRNGLGTDFPMAGSSGVSYTGLPIADRGVVFRLSLANGRALTNEKKHFNLDPNTVAGGAFTSAGYGEGESFVPQPFEYFLVEGDLLLLEIENRDRFAGGSYHAFELVILGERHVRP